MSEAIQTVDDVVGYLRDVVERLDTLAAVLPSGEERLAEEERRAWDACVAACLADATVSLDEALTTAEGMLLERRKRFGAGKEPPKPCLLAVTEDLLERTIEALVGDCGPETRAVLAQQLRALVSE